jgi:dipeptidyl aminopeptidase/acylaminoacyl peptidase
MRPMPIPALSSLLLTLALTPALLAEQRQAYGFMDIFDTQFVTDPQISPDGSQVVYVRNQFDIMEDRRYTNLWLIGSDGSGHQPLTSGRAGYSSPRWSPDGTRLAFVSGEEGSSQIFVRWMAAHQAASITNLTHSPGSLTWSPDGQWIAFTMEVPAPKPSLGSLPSPPEGARWAEPSLIIEGPRWRTDGRPGFVAPGHTHLFVVSAEGGAPRQLTRGDFDHSSPAWAPDGRFLIVSANRNEDAALDPNNTHLYEVEVATGELRRLTSGRGPHANPRVSPDGRRIAFTGYQDRFVGYQLTRLYVMGRDGSGVREVEHGLDRDVGGIEWASDGSGFFARYVTEGDARVAFISLDGGVTDLASSVSGSSFGRPYLGGSFSVAKDGRFAFTLGTPEHPSDVAVARRNRPGTATRLTNLNENLFKARALGAVEEIWYTSSHDGWDIQGWIIYPPDFDPERSWPLILEIHGGPYAPYGAAFTAELQLKASQGYVVLYTNPRGSPGYGEEFAAYINHNYPSQDYDDLMSGVDHVIARGFIDQEQLFITGGSGGGVLTAWVIGKTDRFAAAVPSKPVINWYSWALTADMYPFGVKYWFTAPPWEDPAQYLERSPLSLVGNVTTPTMVLTGEADYRTPMSESEQYYAALQLRGVESMMVRVPDAPHSIITRPSNLIRKVGYIVGWFDRYRKVPPAEVAPSEGPFSSR